MKRTKLSIAFAAALLLTASCASDETTQTGEQTKETTEGYTVFTAGKETNQETDTRTSLDYTSGAFYWESGDNIFVKDDGGTFQTATNAVTGTGLSLYRFQVPGTFSGTSYTVFYPGKNGSNDQVTIATAQTQTTPADTKHLGEAGDCGMGTANGSGNGFAFKLDHKAAYLVFQPYTSDALLKDCYLTKIEVISDNNIAGTYTLDPTTKKLTGTGTSNTITLTTTGTGAYTNGFPMTTTSASLSTNGAYMVIAPGQHALQVRYWLKSLTDNIEGTVTKQLSNFNYEENNYYDMTADLQINHYSSSYYYTWDPTNVTNCPNVNEMCWYVMQGDPYWDSSELWAETGHLYTGGVWLKKQANISGYSATAAPDGIDYTTATMSTGIYNHTLGNGKPNNLSHYFYLPAISNNTNLRGISGIYWSNTEAYTALDGYSLYFDNTYASVLNYPKYWNIPLWTSDDSANQYQPKGL